ncbi:MAG: hypothetical protein JWQ81_1661 [Amycolatopsis sp.]|jgi:hypothetical protein|uniref:hypothetical protein n=1 Tax=Amycolatopsis sp. TaxID=37632 RepID=UPI0026132072|nr:hypothetical protein [Amycolatopsis sp.]MCU1680922.1 hypothetical protein [Amycolatopsis sp.]
MIAAVGAAIVVVGGTVGAVVAAPASPTTFTLNGAVSMLNSGDLIQANGDGGCYGIGSYSDLATGATVTVRDESGLTVAMGTLGASDAAVTPQTGFVWGCDIDFAVVGVPDGHPQYQVSVANRAPQVVSLSTARTYGAVLNI